MKEKKRILIWEMLGSINGGQRVALDILDSLKEEYSCSFIVPGSGPLLRELIRRKIDFFIVPIGDYSNKKKSIIDIIKFIKVFPKILFYLFKIINHEKIDIIYSNGARTFLWSAIIGKFMRKDVIWHVHNYFEDKKIVILLTLFGSFNSVKHLLFVSNDSRSQFPRISNKSEVLYNSTQIKVTIPCKKKEIKKGDIVHIAHVGVVCEAKGQLVLLKAIPKILERYKNIKVSFIGDYSKNYDYYTLLMKYVQNNNILQYVQFLGQQHNMSSLYPNIHINTVNSIVHSESCPLVILESYAYGIPSIGSNIGGTPEIIKDGKTGFIYQPGDENDLSKKIVKLINNEELYGNVSRSCYTLSKKFSFKNYSKQIKKIIKNL